LWAPATAPHQWGDHMGRHHQPDPKRLDRDRCRGYIEPRRLQNRRSRFCRHLQNRLENGNNFNGVFGG
jgi:hypothetical protein